MKGRFGTLAKQKSAVWGLFMHGEGKKKKKKSGTVKEISKNTKRPYYPLMTTQYSSHRL